jgi:citrate lyase subunit beta/citryl-CoA lyase
MTFPERTAPMTEASISAPPTGRVVAPPLRSILFTPGHRERWVEPARNSGADAVLFDLEDAVPVSEIEDARRIVRTTIEEHGASGPRLMVRTAPPGAPEVWADLDAVVAPGLHAVVLPMVGSVDEVRRVDERLSELEAERGMEVGSTIIDPLCETAFALRFCYELAVSSPRIEYMGAGTSKAGDIQRAIGYRWSAEGRETLTLRSWVLLTLRAAGLRYPITGLWADVPDLDGCRRWCEEARSLGFTGTMAIHPSHVKIINEVFTPTEDQIAYWENIIRLMADHQAEGIGAFTLDGTLIDEADAKTAKVNLELVAQLRSARSDS